ncbi:hypothetical protein [Niabella aquatica]
MKKLILSIVLSASLFFTRACPDYNDTNNPAIGTFNTIFKNASHVSWFFHSQYSFASFSVDQVHIKAWFDKDGKLTRTIRYYKEETLAPFIKLCISQKYRLWEIFGITELSSKYNLCYSVVLKKDGQIRIINIDQAGTITLAKAYRNGS